MGFNAPEPDPDAPTLARQTGEWHGLTLPPGGEETAPAPVLAPDAVPGYELLGEIGRGGMGVVYRARHLGLNRIVALKMVLAGAHARGADLQRFRAEAEAVARLQHPNVVQVYDVGEANGLPFLSLELCAGSLADRLDGRPWPPQSAAELVETLARAVEAAHQAGVLHRDIKPANVLMASRARERPEFGLETTPRTPVAHAPGSPELVPKLTDFGLAKRIDGIGAGPTATGAILGTPSYMAPEQAGRRTGEDRAVQAGPAVDVYALGAILYEFLTGRPPFLAASPLDTLLQVTRDEPVPPARLNAKTPRDLQTICLKCLEKEPGRRYATAAALADDLRRYLTGEPIAARPASRWERAWKWSKRRPAQAALIAVSALAVVVLLGGSWYFTGRLQVERDNAMWAMHNAKLSETAAIENGKLAGRNAQRAEAEALNARRNNYILAIGQAQLAWQQADVGRLKNLLKSQIPKDGEENLRGFEWHYWNHLARGAPRIQGPIKYGDRVYSGFAAVTYSPDGRRLAATTNSGMAFVWDAASGKVEHAFPQAYGSKSAIIFRPNGRQAALSDSEGLRVFDLPTGIAVLQIKEADISGLAYTPEGGRLVVKAGRQTRIYDAARGELIRTFNQANTEGGGVTVSPDGRKIATGGYPSQLFDLETGQLIRDVARGFSAGAADVAYCPDGQRIAFATNDADVWGVEVRVVAADTGRIVARGRGHSEFGAAIACSLDGRFIATAGNDNTVRLWDAATCKEVRRFQGSSRWNSSVAFSPDGQTLAACADSAIEFWPVDLEQDATTVKVHTTLFTSSVALAPDSSRVLGVGVIGGVIDNAVTPKNVVVLGRRYRGALCATFSADGQRVAAGFANGTVLIWDASSGNQIANLAGLKDFVTSVAFSADGRRLAAAARADFSVNGVERSRPAGRPDRVVIWDTNTGKIVRELAGPDLEQVNAVTLTADGHRMLTGSGRHIIRWWDVDSGAILHTFDPRPAKFFNWMAQVAVSRDGRWAAWAGSNGNADISLCDLTAAKQPRTLVGHQRGIRALTFTADGSRLASAGQDDMVRVWDVTTGQEVLSRTAPRNVVDLGFSSDGRRLSTVGADGTLRTWSGAE